MCSSEGKSGAELSNARKIRLDIFWISQDYYAKNVWRTPENCLFDGRGHPSEAQLISHRASSLLDTKSLSINRYIFKRERPNRVVRNRPHNFTCTQGLSNRRAPSSHLFNTMSVSTPSKTQILQLYRRYLRTSQSFVSSLTALQAVGTNAQC